jgi:hypothetical protein
VANQQTPILSVTSSAFALQAFATDVVPQGARAVICEVAALIAPPAADASLDVFFQHSADGGRNWTDFAHLLLTAVGSLNVPVSLWAPGPTVVQVQSDGALPANTIVQGPIGGDVRIKYTASLGSSAPGSQWSFQAFLNFLT